MGYLTISTSFPTSMAIKENLANTEEHTTTTSTHDLTQRLEDTKFLLLSKVCSSKAGACDSVWVPTSLTEPSVSNTGLWADAGQAELELSQDRNNRKNNAGGSQRYRSRKERIG